MKLGELSPQEGSKKKPKRVGRGPGSGHGKTSGKGHKGYKARSGAGKGAEFEGGQMPLVRRMPKRGFVNIFKKDFSVINLEKLEGFDGKEAITPDLLKEAGIIKKSAKAIKILGDGELNKPLTIKAHKFSKSALEKIQAAGGKAEVL